MSFVGICMHSKSIIYHSDEGIIRLSKCISATIISVQRIFIKVPIEYKWNCLKISVLFFVRVNCKSILI